MKWKEQGESLVKKAEQDEFVADKLLADPDSPAEALGFHLQQAAEKYLKAALSFKQIKFPRTHQLVILLDLLKRHKLKFPREFEKLKWLSPYAVAFRYDLLVDEDIPGKDIDFQSARNTIKKLQKWVKQFKPGSGK